MRAGTAMAHLATAGAVRTRREDVGPPDGRGHLHQHEQRDDGADGHRQAGVALEEERVAEEDEEHQLRRARVQQRAPHPGDHAAGS